MTGPGTAPTARPSSAAKSAVVSEPERSVAWTTTVAAPSAAMIRLRATKHQRCALGARAASRRSPRRARRPPRAAASRAPGRRRARSPASTPIVLPGRLERAGVRRRVDPEREAGDDRHARRRQPAAERARDLEPVRRRAPGADDGDAVLVAERARVAEHVQHRRRVGEVAQALRVLVAAAADRRRARPPPPARARRARRSARSARRPRRDAPTLEQVLVAQREHARRARVRCLNSICEPPGDRGDQVGAPQAVVARASCPPRAGSGRASRRRRRHAASASWWASSRRRLAAMLTCSGPTTSEPSRSATVRATRRMRVWPRAESAWRS